MRASPDVDREHREKEDQPAGNGSGHGAGLLLAARRKGVLELERGEHRFSPGGVAIVDRQRPLLLAHAAQLVRDPLLVEDEGEIHRPPEIGHHPEQHAGSLHGAVL